MTTITVKTIDTSTICPGKGGALLPVVPAGTRVVAAFGEKKVEFVSGWSTPHQLCTQKGAGLGLHNLLVAAGASRTNPVEIQITLAE